MQVIYVKEVLTLTTMTIVQFFHIRFEFHILSLQSQTCTTKLTCHEHKKE